MQTTLQPSTAHFNQLKKKYLRQLQMFCPFLNTHFWERRQDLRGELLRRLAWSRGSVTCIQKGAWPLFSCIFCLPFSPKNSFDLFAFSFSPSAFAMLKLGIWFTLPKTRMISKKSTKTPTEKKTTIRKKSCFIFFVVQENWINMHPSECYAA